MAISELLYAHDEPRIYVTPLAMYKMRYFIDKTEDEIGWLGFVDNSKENVYVIEDVILLKQQVHSATTEIDAGAIAELASELLKTEEGRAKYNKLRMWGHSHVNMTPTPSYQDNSQMDDFENGDYFIRLIGNKKGEWNVCLYNYKANVLWKELKLEIYTEVEIDDTALDNEIKEKVSKMAVAKSVSKPVYGMGVPYHQYFDKYYERDYADYSTYYKEEEKEEKEIKEEKIDEPYEIKGYPLKEDFRNIKRYLASDEGELYYAVTGTLSELEDTIFELYGVHLKPDDLEKLSEELTDIWLKRYERDKIYE